MDLIEYCLPVVVRGTVTVLRREGEPAPTAEELHRLVMAQMNFDGGVDCGEARLYVSVDEPEESFDVIRSELPDMASVYDEHVEPEPDVVVGIDVDALLAEIDISELYEADQR